MRQIVIRCCPLCPEKLFVAARVARRLREDGTLEVRRERGSLGELSVLIDGKLAVDVPMFWLNRPSTIVKQVREQLARQSWAR